MALVVGATMASAQWVMSGTPGGNVHFRQENEQVYRSFLAPGTLGHRRPSLSLRRPSLYCIRASP
jgi:hypothetical protein